MSSSPWSSVVVLEESVESAGEIGKLYQRFRPHSFSAQLHRQEDDYQRWFKQLHGKRLGREAQPMTHYYRLGETTIVYTTGP